MDNMSVNALDRTIYNLLPRKKNLFVSVSGSGGKTTLLQLLGAYCKRLGSSVLLTTTTKIQSPAVYDWKADRFVLSEDEILSLVPEKGKVTLYAETSSNSRKLVSPPLGTLAKLKEMYDVVISEADGSRMMPLKIHTERDPVIPAFNDFTICIMGTWAACEKIQEVAFGYERTLSDGFDGLSKVDLAFLQYVVDSKDGLMKGSSEGKRIALLNGYEALKDEQRDIFRRLEFPEDLTVLCCSEKKNEFIEKLQ